MNPVAVQFVGGKADGTELMVDQLRPEFYFAVAPNLSDIFKEMDNPHSIIPSRKAVYVLLEDSTVYVFKRIQPT